MVYLHHFYPERNESKEATQEKEKMDGWKEEYKYNTVEREKKVQIRNQGRDLHIEE